MKDHIQHKYLISIRLMTFNHESYIKSAMGGIMQQKTNFNIEIVVGDDFSTDQTLDIIRTYKSTKNIHIKILDRRIGDRYWAKRQAFGRLYNFTNILENCSGKYIALLDGDDYWTDPLKLQKQVDFLEENPKYSLTYHRALEVGDKTRVLKNQRRDHDFTFNFLDSLQRKHGATLSMVFRKEILLNVDDFTDLLRDIPVGDWPLECICTLNGSGYFMNEVMGVYRIHGGGMSNSLNREKYYVGRVLFASRLLQLPVAKQHQHIIKSFLFRIYLSLLYYCLVNTHWSSAFDALQKIFKFIPPPKTLSLDWESKFNTSRLIARLPMGLIIGFKNTLFGVK